MSDSEKPKPEMSSSPKRDTPSAAGGDRVSSTGSTQVSPLEPGVRVRHIRFELAPKTIVALVLVVASLWLLFRLWPVLLVLVTALLVAGTLSPAVNWLGRKHVRRGYGIAIVFTAFFIVAFLVAGFTIPALMQQAIALFDHEPALRARVADYLAGSQLTAPL